MSGKLGLRDDGEWVRRGNVLVFVSPSFDPEKEFVLEQQQRPPAILDEPRHTTCGDKRGTPAGSRIHYRARERPCEECRLGALASQKTGRQSLKAKSGTKCAGCDVVVFRGSTRCRACNCRARNAKNDKKEAA